MSREKWTIDKVPNLEGKVAVVTGGNGGLGFESVKAFANKGAEVVLASRSIERGEKAKENILTENPEAQITVIQLDLMDISSVEKFVSNFKEKFSRLDILLNNAGIMTVPYGLTKDGFEKQLGTNHLGHFALTGQLIDVILNTPNSRVVNVSSIAHKGGDMDFENLQFEDGKDYTPMKAYSRSKLANLLFTYELQRFFDEKGVDSLAVAAHPGVSNTNLGEHMRDTFLYKLLKPLVNAFIQKPEVGALAQIRACVDPDVKGSDYYGAKGLFEMWGYPVLVKSKLNSHNEEHAKLLWQASEKLTSVKFS